MQLFQGVIIALEELWAHKTRSSLIIIGVAIGVASLMGMISILLGMRESITEEVSNYEQTVLIVQKYNFGAFASSAIFKHGSAAFG